MHRYKLLQLVLSGDATHLYGVYTRKSGGRRTNDVGSGDEQDGIRQQNDDQRRPDSQRRRRRRNTAGRPLCSSCSTTWRRRRSTEVADVIHEVHTPTETLVHAQRLVSASAATTRVYCKFLHKQAAEVRDYGLEACPLRKSQFSCVNFVINSTFIKKVFDTRSRDVVDIMFNCVSAEQTVATHKTNFLRRVSNSSNKPCQTFAAEAAKELATLWSLVITLRASCGAVYCNRSCLFEGAWVCVCVGGSVTTITRNCVHRSSPNWVCMVVTISSWLIFGRPAPLGRGSAAGWKFLALPYYSQHGVFASPLNVFFITLHVTCGAVYCNRSCLFVGVWVCVLVCVCGWVGLLPR